MNAKFIKRLIGTVVLCLTFAMSANVKTVDGYLNVKGGKTYYKVVGVDKSGIPLIVIHGGPGIPHNCLEALNPLSKERPVVYYDQLGCGKSDRIKDDSLLKINRFVDELDTLVKHLNYKKYFILAHSWGATLAAEYALGTPEPGLDGLILVSPFLSAAQWNYDQLLILQKMPEKLRNALIESEVTGKKDSEEYQKAMDYYFKKHVLKLEEFPECWNEGGKTADFTISEKMCGSSGLFNQAGELGNVELVNDLDRINVPVLFVCGEDDQASPASIEFYKRHVKNGKTAVIKDTGHMCFLENTKEFNKIIELFLNSFNKQQE